MTQMLTITADNQKSRMTFAPEKGGLATSLVLCDANNTLQELLYVPEDFDLDSYTDIGLGWPFCFPICARISRDGHYGKYLYDGQLYELPIHGFANTQTWQVLNHNSDTITLSMKHTEATLAVYPFEFQVILSYQISDNTLMCEQTYINHGHKPMPYAAGFHPYFLIDTQHYPKKDVMIDFQGKQGLVYNDDLTDIIGSHPAYNTPIAIDDPQVNESLTVLGDSKTTTLTFPDGRYINMTVIGRDNPDLFNHLQLYHIPNEPFFCVEPWTSFPNAINTVDGMAWLSPGQQEHAVLKLVFG